MLKINRIARKALKYIKYLQKNEIVFLQDEEGNLIYIGINKTANEMLKCWQNKPIEMEINGKKGIYYKNKNYMLYDEVKNENKQI